MNPLKIIILGPAHPLRGGIAAFNERLAIELISMGHQVHIETFSLQYPGILFPGKTQYSDDPKPEDLDIHIGINSVNPFNWISVGNRLKQLQADLVICKFWLPFLGPCYGTILRIIKSNRKTKIIAIIDNIIPHEKRIADKPFAQYFANSVDEFVVMSKSVLEDMKKFVQNNIVQYLPHPIYDNYGEHIVRSEAIEYLNLDPNYRYLLFFGVIRDYKGLDLLFHAMAKDKLKGLPIKLIVAGEFYGNENYYRSLIEDLNINDLIIDHMQFIPNDEVKFFFGASDLVVQPYKSATQSGISQIAYHFEVPMIVTKVGGLPEIVPHGECGYVTAIDSEAIADAIYDFFDQHRKDDFKAALRNFKKGFTWQIFTEKLLNPTNASAAV